MAGDVSGIDAIGRTAFAVAVLRAAEHRSPEGLFTDPYAAHFLRAAGIDPERGMGGDFPALMQTQAAVRTRFFDDHLLAAAEGSCRQVVLVASGMDSRPWRLDWPADTEVFEIDQEQVLRFKNEVMEGQSESTADTRHSVAVDLREDWASALRTAGFRDDRPTAWLTEGVLYSLDEAAADQLLTTLTQLSAPGSTLAFDHFQAGPSLRAAAEQLEPGLSRLFQPGPADPAAWLDGHGWKSDVRELADVAGGFGRTAHPVYIPGPGAEGHSWLATATRPGHTG